MRHTHPARGQAGQGLLEYVLILTLVALVVIVALVLFGPALGRTFKNVADGIGGQAQAATATGSPVSHFTPFPPTNTAAASNTQASSSTMPPSATSAPSSTMPPSVTPAPSSTMAPSSTPAPTSTMAPSSTTVIGQPSSTPAPTNTMVPSSTPAPTNTRVPTSTPAPTYTPVPSNTPAPTYTPASTSTAAGPPTATPLSGVILSASAARTGGTSGNALDVTVTVAGSTTLTLIDSVAGTLVSGAACAGTCVVHIGSIGKDAGYIAVVAASGGVLTVWYPAKS